MTGHFSRLAGALLLTLSGIASAATPLLLPAVQSGVRAKSTGDTPVRFNAQGVAQLAPGEEVELTLPNGSRHTYLHEEVVDHGGGVVTWIAQSPLTGSNERAVITYTADGAWGWMATRYGQFRIYPSGEGYDLLAPRTRKLLAPTFPGGDAVRVGDDAPEIAPLKGVATHVAPLSKSLAPKAAPSPTVRSDLMFIYTRDLATKLGSGLMPALYNMVASVNQAYVDSEVAIELRLVRAHMIDYPNSHASLDTLNAMLGVGPEALNAAFAGISYGTNSLRDQVGADFVALLRDGPTDTGGIASLLINPTQYPGIMATQTGAMSVNNYCAQGCEGILAHEIGHNMGNHHDRATIGRDTNGANPLPTGVYNFSYGHYSCAAGLSCNPFIPGGCASGYAGCNGSNANDFGTIMSYFGPQVMKFSNGQLNNCVPAGGSAGSPRLCGGPTVAPAPAGSSDNAQSMNYVRGNVSAYRNQMIANAPASLQFTNTVYLGNESGGTLAITVSRVGGSAGAVAVPYSFSSGTATAGVDFTASSGILNWADGDTANKTISVPVNNDGVTEGNETFTVTLGTPTGAPGVYLGYPTTATAVIREPWPLNGAAPAGFTTPSGAEWAVASDSTADGSGSAWKSGAVFPSGGVVPPPSVTEFTGDFMAGTLTFDYRVNSYPGQGFFEFLVDGTVVLSQSGNGTWQFFSIAIGAGTHTLQWRYRATLTFACGNPGVTPAPPQGASCADRAWIDNVNLPLAAASSTTTVASSVNPSIVGQSVTFTATVAGSLGTPTGTVSFLDGAATMPGCGSVALVAGSAGCTIGSLSAGTHSVSASYSGNVNYAASFSTPMTQVVASGAQLLSASPAVVNFGGQSMNTSTPPVTSTITNTSAGPVTVSAVTVTANFSATHNCGTVPAGGACQVNVVFSPPVAGTSPNPATGSVSIEYTGGGPTQIGLDGQGERSLVTHYYRSILRRAPDSGGKTFWQNEANRVSNLGTSVNETWFAMAQSFFFSPEYASFARDNTGFVTDLYTTFYNRAPDSGGLAYWVGQLNSGLPREVLLTAFMFSPEFATFAQNIFGTSITRAEVDTLVDFYRGLLARLPDNGGFNYWLARFRTAQCQNAAAVTTEVESISSAYALSPEYASRARNTAQYVGDLYNAFLRRGGDLNGVNYWIGQLDNGLRTRENVRVEFKNSAEFQARVNALIAQGCLP